jgi:hypothetical protein
MNADRWQAAGCALALALVAIGPAAVDAAAPSRPAIVKACDDAESVAQCERVLEAEQIRQFPAVAAREGRSLRLKGRAGSAPVELRDVGDPNDQTGAEYRAYAFWDYWPQNASAVVSVTTEARDHYLVVDLDRGTQTRIPAEPILAPDGKRFLAADLCETQCANLIQIWRFDRDRLVRERTFKPAEKWYEADVSWRDAATLEIEFSVAAPRLRPTDPGELVLLRAKPRLLKLSDPAWTVDETGR